jgi:hypothetical protein
MVQVAAFLMRVFSVWSSRSEARTARPTKNPDSRFGPARPVPPAQFWLVERDLDHRRRLKV